MVRNKVKKEEKTPYIDRAYGLPKKHKRSDKVFNYIQV